jgi:rod shape determining protein RodA
MNLRKIFSRVDWLLLLYTFPILGAGLITMRSFGGSNIYFEKQLIWIVISFIVYVISSNIDARFFKHTTVLVTLYLLSTGLLLALFILGHVANGAQSWFSFGAFSFQPSDPMKIVVVLMLAKYFQRRHIEIANWKHLLISGLYAFIPMILVFLQPDFGSAVIIAIVWFGMVLVSGISKKHILLLLLLAVTVVGGLWLFVFEPYQKARIMTFIHPYTDLSGSGYNAYQSTIAVGSGELIGKGLGFGTQSRLRFLPEFQTDFIFAAFAEEWGFIGALLLLVFFGLVYGRILSTAARGASNFEVLFCIGIVIILASQSIINIGMNIGLLPVTGLTLPFMSYGGSHLLSEFLALGILSNIRSYRRVAHRDDMKNEFLGI